MDITDLESMVNHLYLDTAKVALASTAAAVAALWWKSGSRGVNLPPGPRGYPIIGNSLEYVKQASTNRMPQYLQTLHEEHGDIISVQVGAMTFIYIKDGKLAKTLFSEDKFTDRPIEMIPLFKHVIGGENGGGICFNNGQAHLDMRKLALATFRNLGVGKRTLDETIQTECNFFLQVLEKSAEENNGVVCDVKSTARQCTANILHDIIFGFRYEYGDKRWTELLHHLHTFFSVNIFGFPTSFIPALRFVPFINNLLTSQELKKLFAANEEIKKYLRAQIDEHRATYCQEEVRDFVDLFIKNELEKTNEIDMNSLFLVIVDMFRAGADSTANSLAWCIQYLVKYDDIQEELRQEIDEKIGDSVFQREDKQKLVKTNAFVNEVMRYASIAPHTGPHTIRQSMEVAGYTFPANCVIFASLYAMHHDKEYWGDPERFRISRWIDDNGEQIRHENHFQPFATGKRVCPGRQLSSIELILFIVQLLQRFKFERAPGQEDFREDQKEGFLRTPHNFSFKLVKRC